MGSRGACSFGNSLPGWFHLMSDPHRSSLPLFLPVVGPWLHVWPPRPSQSSPPRPHPHHLQYPSDFCARHFWTKLLRVTASFVSLFLELLKCVLYSKGQGRVGLGIIQPLARILYPHTGEAGFNLNYLESGPFGAQPPWASRSPATLHASLFTQHLACSVLRSWKCEHQLK